MSIFADAQVVVLLADYIGLDAGGKVNALGAGFGLCLMQPTGLTAAMSVIVMVDVPARYAGQQCALSLELRNDDTDSAVMIATPPSGQLQPLRVQQAVPLQAVQIPGLYVPPGVVPIRVQLPVAFQDGLPLQTGASYVWRVHIDAQTRPGWQARFYVPGPPPVFGGPAGPGTIQGVPTPGEEERPGDTGTDGFA